MKCECENWATADVGMMAITGHQENCKHRPSEVESLRKLIRELAKGIEEWGNEEDGIYPPVWEAYKNAKLLEGVFVEENHK